MINLITNMDIWSFVDILVIWALIYQFVKLIHGTRAEQVLVGILVVCVAFIISSIAPLSTFHWLLNKFYASILLIVIILFQDELKAALSKIGKNPLSSSDGMSTGWNASINSLDELVRTASSLAEQKVGALIVLEKNIILDRYIEVGVSINAEISHQLLAAIFHPTSPIHDGAVVIKNGRVLVAGCFLPLSQSLRLELHMGTRHRAAFGISEQTDAVVILISEERGQINLVYDGRIEINLSATDLKQRLFAHFAADLHKESLRMNFAHHSPSQGLTSRTHSWLKRLWPSNRS
ncbi:MAG: diadenylate cyclase CdaA [Proteobacteria bacterium]|nr:diadenylate cyclase CdaA [Pseudomonadota bacterium]